MLQNNLKKRMQQAKISAAELERRIKTPYVVTNILNGKSKNPSAVTTLAIARELECSVDELVSGETVQTDKVNLPIVREILEVMQSIPQTDKLTFADFIEVLEMSYDFATKEEPHTASCRFIKWVVAQQIS